MFLGIDLGTSGVKAVLVDDSGRLAGEANAPLGVSNPQPAWSEQDPHDWWAALSEAIAKLDPGLRGQVAAIGLTGQMHGAVLLGESDRVLRPAILWNDGRSHTECVELEATVANSRKITGNLAMPGFTAPKLLWVRKHEPETFAQIRCILLPKDYLRLRMTGEKASDMSDSAGTLWLDVAKRDWSDEMLAATGLTRAHMPRLYEGPEVTGSLLSHIAGAWGMPEVPVIAGGGDNAAGAVGVGVIGEGDAMLSLGTSGVIFAATDTFRPAPDNAIHAFCHCLPDKWHQMAVHLSAASCIDWAARQLNINGPAEFFDLAETVDPVGGPELFLPYLSGERTPHNDPFMRAGWLECGNETNPARLASAVLEGVAFTLADGMLVLREAGTKVECLSVIGGGSRSHHWGRILSAALDVRLDYLAEGTVGPAFGAARLARLAVTDEDAVTACTKPPVLASVEPESNLVARLAPKLEKFRATNRALSSRQES